MTPIVSPLRKAFNILNTFLFPVIAAFLLDRSFVLATFKDITPSSNALLLILLALLPVKIALFAGLYGAMAEMASGEAPVLTLAALKRNAKDLWAYTLLVTGIPMVAHFLIFFTGPGAGLSLPFVTAHLEPLLHLILISIIIRKKYLRRLDIKKEPFSLKRNNVIAIITLFAGSIFLYHTLQLPFIQSSALWAFPLLLSKYLSILIFLYLSILLIEKYPQIEAMHSYERELYLINPVGSGLFHGIASLFFYNFPPAFVVLKALTPKHYGTKVFNRSLWRDRYYAGGKLVAITCFTPNSGEAYKIAKEFRKRGSTVVMGGPHVTYLPDEALEYCDSVIIGDAEGAWEDVIKDYEDGKLQAKYSKPAKEEDYQKVHQELLHSPPEVIKDFLETTRGCKFRCRFCTIPALSHGKLIKKSVRQIVELLEKIKPRVRRVNFIDNNIYSDPAYAKELFKALKPLKIQWVTQCTIDIAKNDELLKLAKESGCSGLLIGYEIFGDSAQSEQGGKFAMADKYIEFTKKIKKLNIPIKAHFIFGFDSDSLKDLLRLWRFCFAIHPYFSIVSLLTPLPGSEVYYDMIRKERVINLNWQGYTLQNPVVKFPKMNHSFLAVIHPFVMAGIMFTTSKGGHLLFLMILSVLILTSLPF